MQRGEFFTYISLSGENARPEAAPTYLRNCLNITNFDARAQRCAEGKQQGVQALLWAVLAACLGGLASLRQSKGISK